MKYSPKGGLRILYEPQYLNKKMNRVRPVILVLNALKPFITGDDSPSPYMSGPELVKFFNLFGAKDEYLHQEGGLPGGLSRNEYALETLKKINGKLEFKSLVEALADSRTVSAPDVIASLINEIIKHDGYKLEKDDYDIFKVTGKELNIRCQLLCPVALIHFKCNQNDFIASRIMLPKVL